MNSEKSPFPTVQCDVSKCFTRKAENIHYLEDGTTEFFHLNIKIIDRLSKTLSDELINLFQIKKIKL